jgi:hypothetical protein
MNAMGSSAWLESFANEPNASFAAPIEHVDEPSAKGTGQE